MLLSVSIASKTIGTKQLFRELRFSVEAREKVAIIGRNGVGKTTLFGMLSEQPPSDGIIFRRGTRVVSTAQEHHTHGEQSVLDYIITNLPDYARLKKIIDTYPAQMGDDLKKIGTYTSALEQFSSLGYYTTRDGVLESLAAYQIDHKMALGPLKNLSGGQKRFMELVRIEHADADLALIDEPTNHMDYVAKQAFILWLKQVKHTVIVISHDRDVLHWVDRIIELKDGKAHSFKGNYDAYLKQNATSTSSMIHGYEIGLRTLENLHKQILWARARKPGWHGKGEKNPYDVMERRLRKQYDGIQTDLQKPTFWIDRESAEGLGKKASEGYEKYKTRNIRIHKPSEQEDARELLRVEDVQLGYDQQPLFEPVNFSLRHGDRLQLSGRNGVGKTTLIRGIVSTSRGDQPATWRGGHIVCDRKLRLSVYEQEVNPTFLSLTLADAIERTYHQLNLTITNEMVMNLMGNYLFDPYEDGRLRIEQLSGGQKARLQIITMLANNPNVLVLDEPTNHLDLPSIEELENTLRDYHGALLYVSHDSYFAKQMGGEHLTLQPTNGANV